MSLQDLIKNLSLEDIDKIRELKFEELDSIKSYSFSQITLEELKSLVSIKINFDNSIFDSWFNSDIKLDKNIEEFLIQLLQEESFLLRYYNEEDLKLHFLSQIFNHIKFTVRDKDIRFYSEEQLIYKNDRFILKGTPDFFIAKGLRMPEVPYFFIQEFKRTKGTSDPEEQLLAELISAVELNNSTMIKGAYIKGAIWNFMILEKLDKDSYQYFISDNFDSSKIDDLKSIYRHLLYVKKEIMESID